MWIVFQEIIKVYNYLVNTINSALTTIDTVVDTLTTNLATVDTVVDTINAKTVKIQSGSVVVTNSTTFPVNITISAVASTSKTEVRLNNIFSNAIGSYSVTEKVDLSAALTSTTNLQIAGSIVSSSLSITLQWVVIEHF